MSYANTIKEIRKQCALSQEEFARELGVSFASINRWEREKTKPSKMALKAIEAFCNKHNITDILNGGDRIEN